MRSKNPFLRFILPFILLAFQPASFGQKSIYGISVQTIAGQTIPLASFKGKKMMIAVTGVANLEKAKLKFFDSMQKAHPGIVLIIIPGADLGPVQPASALNKVKDSISKSLILTSLVSAKKSTGSQNELTAWLTHSSQNIHFDIDVTTDDQLYFISESGFLYSVMEKGPPLKIIGQILNQADVKE